MSIDFCSIASTSLTILLYSLLNSLQFIFPLAMFFSNLFALSSVIYLPSALVFNPAFLALVMIFNVSLNLPLLAPTYFGSFNLFGCLSGKDLYSEN